MGRGRGSAAEAVVFCVGNEKARRRKPSRFFYAASEAGKLEAPQTSDTSTTAFADTLFADLSALSRTAVMSSTSLEYR